MGRVRAEQLQKEWGLVGHRMEPVGLAQERVRVPRAGSSQRRQHWAVREQRASEA